MPTISDEIQTKFHDVLRGVMSDVAAVHDNLEFKKEDNKLELRNSFGTGMATNMVLAHSVPEYFTVNLAENTYKVEALFQAIDMGDSDTVMGNKRRSETFSYIEDVTNLLDQWTSVVVHGQSYDLNNAHNRTKGIPGGDGRVLYTDYSSRYPDKPVKYVLTRDGAIYPFTHKDRYDRSDEPTPPKGFKWEDAKKNDLDLCVVFEKDAKFVNGITIHDNAILAEYDPQKGLTLNDKMSEHAPRVLGVKFINENHVELTSSGRTKSYLLNKVPMTINSRPTFACVDRSAI